MVPSSRFAGSLKPSVAYLVLNFCALWKKQTFLPFLAYAGIPYQSLGERAGALFLMIVWSRLARARSCSGSSAIFASTARSPSASSAAAFISLTRSFIAAFSSAVNPSYRLPVAALLLGDFGAAFVPGFVAAIVFADLLSAALSRGPVVTDRRPASYFSGSICNVPVAFQGRATLRCNHEV